MRILSRRSLIERLLAPYCKPTIAAADVDATPPTASASASGTVSSSTAFGKSRTTGTPQIVPESQPSVRIEETVARLIEDLEGA